MFVEEECAHVRMCACALVFHMTHTYNIPPLPMTGWKIEDSALKLARPRKLFSCSCIEDAAIYMLEEGLEGDM